MRRVLYKGFEIEPAPNQLRASREWTLHVFIRRHFGGTMATKNFSGSSRFKTRDEAIENCIDFARQIIDGAVANCSVDDL